jgi:hypothetical protein
MYVLFYAQRGKFLLVAKSNCRKGVKFGEASRGGRCGRGVV